MHRPRCRQQQQVSFVGSRSSRISRTGKQLGDNRLTSGAIYHFLQNRIYIGKIVHQGKAYAGEQDAIIEEDLFEQVQQQIQSNRISRRNGEHVDAPSLIPSIEFDGLGRPMTPTKTLRSGRCYSYYAPRRETKEAKEHPLWRVPASDLEEIVIGKLQSFLRDHSALQYIFPIHNPDKLNQIFTAAKQAFEELSSANPHGQRKLLLDWIAIVRVGNDAVEFKVHLDTVLPNTVSSNLSEQSLTLSVPTSIIRNGKQTRLAIPPSSKDALQHKDGALIKLVAKVWNARCAIEASKDDIKQVAAYERYESDYFARLVRLGYLAPDIISAVIEGKQPASLNRRKLARIGSLLMNWGEQRALLGFTAT